MTNEPTKEISDCPNCAASLEKGNFYCADCGQKVMHGHPTLWKLFSDFFDTVFDLDNRVFRTMGALIIPGKLTKNYLRGKRRTYLNPLRIFFFSAVVMVAMGSVLIADLVREELEGSVRENQERGFYALFYKDLQLTMDSVLMVYPNAEEVLENLDNRLEIPNEESKSLGYLIHNGGLNFTPKKVEYLISESVSKTPETLADEAGVTHWFERFQLIQLIRLQNLGVQGITTLMGQSVWGLLFLIPLCGIMLKIVYIRQSRWFIEHFVFSIHTHTFLFLCLAIATLYCYFFNNSPLGYWIVLGLVPLYFLISLKVVYGQTWGKTILKAFLLLFGYQLIISICLSISLAISIILY